MLVKKDRRLSLEYIIAINGKIAMVALIETAKELAITFGNTWLNKFVRIGQKITMPITQK